MTALLAPPAAEVELPEVSRRGARWSTLWAGHAPLPARWAVWIAVLALVFAPTWAQVARAIGAGDTLAYLPLVAGWTIAVALATGRHRSAQLPIHDKETDGIVGVTVLLVALVGQRVLAPRLATVYPLWHPDLFAAWLFGLGASILLFGLRPTASYRWAWLTALLAWPLPFRLATSVVGVGASGCAVVTGLISMALGVIVVGGGRWRRVVGLGAVTLGAVLGVAVVRVGHPPVWVAEAVPAVFAAVSLTASFPWLRRFAARVGTSRGDVAVDKTTRRIATVLAAGLLAALILPSPPVSASLQQVSAAGSVVGWPQATGWQATSIQNYAFAPRYFGTGATWQRTTLHADRGRRDWDKDSRPRTVQLDVLTVARPVSLLVLPTSVTYLSAGQRSQHPITVALGHGVTGQLYASIDEVHQLTWSMLTVQWLVHSGGHTLVQRWTLVSVDDHRDGAPFPQPAPALLSESRSVLTRIVRGDASQQSNDTGAPKDAAMLTSLARGLVSSAVGG